MYESIFSLLVTWAMVLFGFLLGFVVSTGLRPSKRYDADENLVRRTERR